MDILKDKHLLIYRNLSRYANRPVYYNTLDNKYMHGTGTHLKKDTKYSLYKIKHNDTLDTIALEMYNNPTLYWVISDFNGINDPFATLIEGTYIKIPVLSVIEFQKNAF